MGYWTEFGLQDARGWARQAEEPDIHPVTREYYLRQATRCLEAYLRHAGDVGMLGIRTRTTFGVGTIVARSEATGDRWVVTVDDYPNPLTVARDDAITNALP